MSIQSEIARLIQAKAALIEQIEGKGVAVPDDASIDDLAALVRAISIGDDTSDATAIAADIVSPKTAYVNGEKATGEIQDMRASTIYFNGLLQDESLYENDGLRYTFVGNAMEVDADTYVTDKETLFSVLAAELADSIGLTADKIAAGETVLGIAGIHSGGGSAAATCTVRVSGVAHRYIAYTTVDASGNIGSGLSATGTAAVTKELVCACNSMLTVLFITSSTLTASCVNCSLLARTNYAATFWITAGAGETAQITFSSGSVTA